MRSTTAPIDQGDQGDTSESKNTVAQHAATNRRPPLPSRADHPTVLSNANQKPNLTATPAYTRPHSHGTNTVRTGHRQGVRLLSEQPVQGKCLRVQVGHNMRVSVYFCVHVCWRSLNTRSAEHGASQWFLAVRPRAMKMRTHSTGCCCCRVGG